MVLTPNNMVWLADILKTMPIAKQVVTFHLCSCIQNGILTAQLEGKTDYVKTRKEIIDIASVSETKDDITYADIEIAISIFKKAGYAVNGNYKYGPKGNSIRISWLNVKNPKKDEHVFNYDIMPITNLKTFYMGRVRLELTEKIKPPLIDMNLTNIIRVISRPYICKNNQLGRGDMVFKLLYKLTNDSPEGLTLSKMIRDDIIEILSPEIEISAGNIFIDISRDVKHLTSSSSSNFDSREIRIVFDIKIVPITIAMGMITEELNNRIEKDRSLLERCAHALGLIK